MQKGGGRGRVDHAFGLLLLLDDGPALGDLAASDAVLAPGQADLARGPRCVFGAEIQAAKRIVDRITTAFGGPQPQCLFPPISTDCHDDNRADSTA